MIHYRGIQIAQGADVERLDPDTLRDFLAMAAAYNADTRGVVRVNSAYRSPAQQAALHAADPARASAPGRSMHNYGYAIDIQASDAEALEQGGYLRRFGFHRPLLRASYPEPWHIERRGIVYQQVRAAAAGAGLVLAVGVLGYILLTSHS